MNLQRSQNMNKLIVILLAFSLFSCEKICSVTSVLCASKNKTPEAIDFTQIDVFPQFKDCDSILNYNNSKTCFETSLHSKISERIQNLKLNTNETITDTILVNFSIQNTGSFICNKIKINDDLNYSLPNLTAEVQKIIHGLAPISPAQKRGIPVTSTYTIPLVIETN